MRTLHLQLPKDLAWTTVVTQVLCAKREGYITTVIPCLLSVVYSVLNEHLCTTINYPSLINITGSKRLWNKLLVRLANWLTLCIVVQLACDWVIYMRLIIMITTTMSTIYVNDVLVEVLVIVVLTANYKVDSLTTTLVSLNLANRQDLELAPSAPLAVSVNVVIRIRHDCVLCAVCCVLCAVCYVLCRVCSICMLHQFVIRKISFQFLL